MKKKVIGLTLFVFSICILSFCCNNKTAELSGKWYSLSDEEYEYTEYDITDSTIGAFSHYMGNLGKVNYTMEDDSLYFRYIDFKIRWVTDDQVYMILESGVTTMYRLADTIKTFHSLRETAEQTFDNFYNAFEKRAQNAWIKHGYFTKDEIEASYIINDGYSFIPATDSTSYIAWGDANYRNVSKTHIRNYLIEKTSLNEKNSKYLVLKTNTGSDTRTTTILPLQQGLTEKIYFNYLVLDLENQIIIYEVDNTGGPLIAENFNSGKKQVIGSDWPACGSAFPHYCIENIELIEKELYISWSVPHKIEKDKSTKTYQVTLDL